MTKDSRLAIMARKAQSGQGKRRLAATLGDDKTLLIYKELISHTAKAVLGSKLPAVVFFYPEVGDKDIWTEGQFDYELQPHVQDLGERIAFCMKQALDRSNDNGAIVMGTDCPYISSDLLQQASKSLETHDAVIGPSTDGGYYLLGLKKFDSSIFKLSAWSTNTVAAETRNKIAALHWSLAELPTLEDIDDEDAWHTFVKTSKRNS